ncbi:hypothetical protein D9756_006612 [Leucocoprinus leucothites]|uniref:ribonuclease H n=1 Tax=Leucocoprinus leucothites TaxID=201217 RepID=A0A8H5G253_9AGAR|nr:hypothetical protein D9756_006612 [Leucoagaricus leucothites]
MAFSTNRNFFPPHIGDRIPSDISRYDREDGYTHILRRTRRGLSTTPDIAVFVDGACTNNGNSYAHAGMGIHFGPGSWRNFREQLRSGLSTSQRAEIQAAILALEQIKHCAENEDFDAGTVVVVSDSEYLVRGITDRVYDWRENDWYSYRTGRKVGNWKDFADLDDLIDQLEDEYGVFVKFWCVDRSLNQDADREAGRAIGRGY